MKNKNVTNLGQFRSDFTLNSPAMSYLGLLFLQFSAVLYFLPEPMTMGLKILLDLKTKAILLLLTSLFLPFWLGPALASLASLSNNTAGLSDLKTQPWADSHGCQPARLDLALAMRKRASAVSPVISGPFQLGSIIFSFPMFASN